MFKIVRYKFWKTRKLDNQPASSYVILDHQFSPYIEGKKKKKKQRCSYGGETSFDTTCYELLQYLVGQVNCVARLRNKKTWMLLILLQKSPNLHFSWLLFTSLKHLPVNLLDLLNKLTKISSPICSYKFYTIPYTPGIVEFTGSPEKEISAGICCYLSMISKKSEEENIDYNLWADILWDCCA